MRACPQCSRTYDNTLNFCLEDGNPLTAVSDELPTAILQPYASATGDESYANPFPEIRYCTTADGARVAYSVIGSGQTIVRVLGHFTHLEMEWEWPDLRHYWERLAERFTVIRYDGRGIGLSEKFDGEFTEETRQLDLDAVLKAAVVERATLIGISEGGWTAALYAGQNPERIERVILYGCYCHGAQVRPGYDPEEDEALFTLLRKGWGRDTPAFRQVITSQFFRTDADPKLIGHFNDMQRASADPDTAARYMRSIQSRGNGEEIYKQLEIPTLVLQARDDLAVDPNQSRLLASIIPNAHLVMLPGGSHYFPTDRTEVTRIVNAINKFMDEN